MGIKLRSSIITIAILLVGVIVYSPKAYSQCANVGFENGNFTGWTGTWGDGVCNGGTVFGICVGGTAPDPYQNNGLNQGVNNAAPNSTPEKNHFIMTGGYDALVGGTTLPVVYPGNGGSYSMRLGNAQAEDGGETIKYSFTVDQNNVNFTYHYAVVMNGGTHGAGDQAYFNIRMTDANGNGISCAAYNVDATTQASIGGFLTQNGVTYKPWSSVFIPLNNYIGQTVTIEFITRDCNSNGGSHWCYAYIDAECAPMEIISSSPQVCGGQNVTLTAPNGAATYSWTGPGVVPPTANQQAATINQPGLYTVTMTTLGNTPCTFSMDTLMPASPSNPTADFNYTPACAGQPMSFTDISTPSGGLITTWVWDFNADLVPDALTPNATYTFNTPGTYPVSLAVIWPPCTAYTTVSVVVSDLPTSPFTVTSPVCEGQTSTITYTGNAPANATYNWNFDGGTIVTGSGAGPYTVSWATPGAKNITLDVALGQCVSPVSTQTVTVNAGPTLVMPSASSVCSGVPATITIGGAASYSWSPATGLSATTGATVTANPATTTTYTVTGTTAGCTTSEDIIVTVLPYPTVTVNPTTSVVCAGTPTTFTANGATTYTWQPATGLSATTGISVDATPLATTNYMVIGTTNGCADTALFDVTVNPSPVLVLSADPTICEGATTTLTANGATTYTWTPATGLSATTGSSVDATPAVTTTYTVTGTTNGCSSSGDITVTVNTYPNVNVAPAAASICLGQTQNLLANGGPNYAWSPAIGLSATTGASVDATPLATTTYMVVSSNQGCNDTAYSTITVNPIPVIGVSPDVTICSGTSTPLTANGGTTYVWSPATGLSASSGSSVTASPLATTTYTVTGTSSGCSSTANVTVTVNPTPVVTVDPPATAYCDGLSATLNASGAAAYVWSPATGLDAINGSTVVANPTTNTTYTVTGTTNGCSNTATADITVNPNPVVDFEALEVAGCEPFCTYFTDKTTLASGTYSLSWDMGDNSTSTQNAFQHCYTQDGLYTVALTATSNKQCVTKLILTDYITVHPLPVAGFMPDPISASILYPIFEFEDESNGAVSWYWDFGDGQTLSPDSASPIHLYNGVEPGVYTVQQIVQTQYGCTDTVTGTIEITPQISLYVPNSFTADNNGHNDVFYVYGEGIVDFHLRIFDRWGEQIYYSTDMTAGWDGNYKNYPVKPDVYVYVIHYIDLNGDTGQRRGNVTLLR